MESDAISKEMNDIAELGEHEERMDKAIDTVSRDDIARHECDRANTNLDSTDILLEGGKLTPSKTFCVDYCKRGTTKCKRCKKHILKDVLRIGKSALFKTKIIYQFYHITCAFNLFKSARVVTNVITSVEDIDGVNMISDEDRMKITQMVDELNAMRKIPLAQPKAKTFRTVPLLQDQN